MNSSPPKGRAKGNARLIRRHELTIRALVGIVSTTDSSTTSWRCTWVAAAVTGRAEADPELAFVLLRLAEDIVRPVTAVNGEAGDPCALHVGRRRMPAAVHATGLGAGLPHHGGVRPRSIIRFAVNVIPGPRPRGHADALEAIRDTCLMLTDLLVTIAEELVFRVTALPSDLDDICANSFVLDELAVLFGQVGDAADWWLAVDAA
ncbi:hypothetical protein AB0N19_40305, partial [Streptomyces sp. NPDC051132]|uniref:hypothetical protein n=1 Tax=Streptomyces sp. NPDC051132 TaxID=3155667 RepID=UPI00344617DE